jgi:hypothetical protein
MLRNLIKTGKDTLTMVRYGTPLYNTGSIALDAQSTQLLGQLKANGIIKIQNEMTTSIAKHIQSFYFDKFNAKDDHDYCQSNWQGKPQLFTANCILDRYKGMGTTHQSYISFQDPGIRDLVLNQQILGIIAKYLKRQPYYRNQPKIQEVKYKKGPTMGNGQFHVDHLHQISIMLLVSPVTLRDTHMQYYLKSNRRNILKEGILQEINQSAHYTSQLNPKDIFHCVGEQGSLFVFDASGYHRANYQEANPRRMLHFNITTGHNIEKFIDKYEQVAVELKLDQHPQWVKKYFSYLS